MVLAPGDPPSTIPNLSPPSAPPPPKPERPSCPIVCRQVFKVPWILQFEPSLDALGLRSNV